MNQHHNDGLWQPLSPTLPQGNFSVKYTGIQPLSLISKSYQKSSNQYRYQSKNPVLTQPMSVGYQLAVYLYFFCFYEKVGVPISSQEPRTIWTNNLRGRDFDFIFKSTQKAIFTCTVVMKPAPSHITISVDGAVISSGDSRVTNLTSTTTGDGVNAVWFEVNKIRGIL